MTSGSATVRASSRSWLARLAAFLGVDRGSALPVFGAGLVVSMAILVPVISYPSLVFSGPLQPYSGIGVGIGLITALVLTMSLVIGGAIPGTVAVGQSEPAVVLGVVATAMAMELQAAGAPERLLPTVAMTIAVSALAAGAIFFLLGRLRMGNLIRFVPYPLIVGFIGGMGWLLIGGAVRVVTALTPSLEHACALAEPAMLLRWLPAMAAGTGLWALQRWRPRALNVPLAALAIVGCFWAVVLASGTPPTALAAEGWMLAPVPPLQQWLPTHRIAMAQDVDWGVLLDHWPQILTLMTVSLLGVLMQASVIEIAARADVDLNRELRALGVGNIVGSLGGGMAGYHSLSTSLLSIRIGRPTRATGLVVACVILAILCFGGDAIASLPKLLIGGLLFYVGLDVLIAALLNQHLRRSWPEYAIAMLVFVVVAFVGLLEGLGVGVAAGLVLFVVNYSQVDVVRHESSAVEHHSNVVRSTRARSLLDERGEQVMILELQGYIFFGTSNLLLNRIRARLIADVRAPLRFVLLDFRRVTGIDSSVSLSLDKLVQYGRAYDLTLIVTGLAQHLRGPFERLAPAGEEQARPIRIEEDLDHGLEYAENRLLATSPAGGGAVESLEAELREAGGDESEIALLMRRAERRTYVIEEPLISQGDQSDDIFYIERGAVTVRVVLAGGRTVRMRTMGAGTVVGEIAMYLRLPRSADVVAAEETVAVRISAEALAAMRREMPGAAALLHAFLARELSEKLHAATKRLAAMQS
jgi:sulfate permease, SulP family